jgi:signal transduction histidine kinase
VEGKDIILKADEAYINVLMNGAKQGAPLSLMSAPIVGGGEVWGAVRCSAPVDGPTYFADRETKLLELISGQIGHFISDAHHRFALNQANRLYLTIAETVSSLTSLCSEVVSTSGGVRILQDSVSAIHDALRLSRCVTVRWRKGAGTDFDRSNFVSSDTRKACVPLKLPDPWLADLHQGKPFVAQADEPSQSEKLDYLDAIGAADAHVWIAPVRFGDKEMFGYLEIIFETTEPLPEHISKIVDVVARQLGLYHTLAQAISGLRDKEKELQAKADFESDSAESYKRTLMNLEHQIQAPLRHATRRFPMAIRQADSAGDLNLLRQIQFLNGIVRRASKVAANVRFFARLESRQPVELKLMSYRFEDIRKFLIEAARDNELIADSARGVRFDVEKSSFDALPRDGKIALDKNLLDQAVNDLLDNAAKYSFEGQVVKLSARTTKGHFVISIVNRGLRIGPQEVSTVIKRGTRGALAQVDVGEGSGIGLWIVDEIMKAHRGRLEIIPTTSDHLTQIQLFFPLERSL